MFLQFIFSDFNLPKPTSSVVSCSGVTFFAAAEGKEIPNKKKHKTQMKYKTWSSICQQSHAWKNQQHVFRISVFSNGKNKKKKKEEHHHPIYNVVSPIRRKRSENVIKFFIFTLFHHCFAVVAVVFMFFFCLLLLGTQHKYTGTHTHNRP